MYIHLHSCTAVKATNIPLQSTDKAAFVPAKTSVFAVSSCSSSHLFHTLFGDCWSYDLTVVEKFVYYYIKVLTDLSCCSLTLLLPKNSCSTTLFKTTTK